MSETISQITEKVKIVSDLYAKRCDIKSGEDWYLLKLSEELGELTQCYLSATNRGRIRDADNPEKVAEETADLLAHILLFADHMNIDIEKAMTQKWYQYLPENNDHE